MKKDVKVDSVEVETPEENVNNSEVCEKDLLQQIESLTAENEKLIALNAENEKKAEEYKQSWYRTAADFENFKKRNNKVS